MSRRPPAVVVVASTKGGTSKTTIAVHLAVAAERAGLATVIAELDPQQSAWRWRQYRKEARPDVVVAPPGSVRKFRDLAMHHGFDLAIVDTPPTGDATLLEALSVANLAVMVSRPSPIDIWASETLAQSALVAGCRGLFVLNQVPGRRGGVEAPDVVESCCRLRDLGFPVSGVGLRMRAAYRRSIGLGVTAMELDPRSVAAHEVTRLFEALLEYLWPSVRGSGSDRS